MILSRLAICTLVAASLALVDPLPGDFSAAAGTTLNVGSWGNCNYNVPHGWSNTQWSGYASNAYASVNGDLWRRDGTSWTWVMGTGQSKNGGSGTVWADNYLGQTYSRRYFQETAWHTGSMISGSSNSHSSWLWCP